jgi:citronellyl-CoA dehydrogenase
VRVPQRYVIGAEGMGFMMQMMQFQEERMYGAANALGGMEACIEQTIEYCRTAHHLRSAADRQPGIHFRMAELQTEVELLRALVWKACEAHIGGEATRWK